MAETHFTETGKCVDEVTFVFDDDKKLFVSKSLLCYASPVFLAMFTTGFKEETTGVVEMKEKQYDDVLEFLLTLHPDIQKPITEENVNQLLPLAVEYQARRLIRNCQSVLKKKLNSDIHIIETNSDEIKRISAAKDCLHVLSLALLYEYNDIIKVLTVLQCG